MAENGEIVSEMNKTLKTKQIAAIVGIAEATVRKYAKALKEANYKFKTSDIGRLFTKEDGEIFHQVKEVRDKAGVKLDHACAIVVAQFNKTAQTMAPDEVPSNKGHEALHQQQEAIAKLEERLERQESRQDLRDENVIQLLREMAETKKQIAASKEKKWYKFWK
ncbi:DUF3967 domain-containing protein [Priestia megaterium]|uniref:DUF3967 domain-containing protein n=1 Tax=Priestia megaterium TaxID=1404 RepID=UPI000BF2736C|nr:DUF3967 domain-containing protein [Priestia megaterium]PFR90687.1 hypothetical protein COK39_24645 [Priestia megaterium]